MIELLFLFIVLMICYFAIRVPHRTTYEHA